MTDEQVKGNIAERLRELLQRADMKASELADSIEESRMNISRYLRGLAVPGAGVLTRMAKHLGCTTDYLLGMDLEEKRGKNRPRKKSA